MDIASYIIETLESHSQVAIKGLGTFSTTTSTAAIDPDTQTISAPKKVFSFETTVHNAALGHLIQYISSQRNLSEPSTNYFIDKWVEIVLEEVKTKGLAYRKPLGYFFNDEEGTIYFSENNPAGEGSDGQGGSGTLLDFVKLPFGKKQDNAPKIAALKSSDSTILHTSAVDDSVVVPEPAPRDEQAAMAAARELLKKDPPKKDGAKKEGFFARLFKRKPKAPKPLAKAPVKGEAVPPAEIKTEAVVIPDVAKETAKPAAKKLEVKDAKKVVAAVEKPMKDDKMVSPTKKKPIMRITALLVVVLGIVAAYYFFGSQITGMFSGKHEDTLVVKQDSMIATVDTTAKEAQPSNDFSKLQEGARFQIIIGSYDNPDGAAAFMRKMVKKGIKGSLHIVEGDGRFRIAAGGFSNLNKTKAFLAYYQDQVAADSWILQQ